MDNFIAHILVVDDDDGIRSLVKKYLNENNFLISTADNAEDANKKIELIKFDLIILDIMMPGKSGLEFIQENKKNIRVSDYFINCQRWTKRENWGFRNRSWWLFA